MRPLKETSISVNQLRVFQLIRQQKDIFRGCHSCKQNAGRTLTIKTMIKNGWIKADGPTYLDEFLITEEGEAYLAWVRGLAS